MSSGKIEVDFDVTHSPENSTHRHSRSTRVSSVVSGPDAVLEHPVANESFRVEEFGFGEDSTTWAFTQGSNGQAEDTPLHEEQESTINIKPSTTDNSLTRKLISISLTLKAIMIRPRSKSRCSARVRISEHRSESGPWGSTANRRVVTPPSGWKSSGV